MSRKVSFSLISRFLGKHHSLEESSLSSSVIDLAEVVLSAPSLLKPGYLPSSLCGHAPWDLHSLHNPHFQRLISLGLRFLLVVQLKGVHTHSRRTHTQIQMGGHKVAKQGYRD